MTGVEYMNDDPSEVHVLYGNVTCSDSPFLLQDIADGIVSHFVKEGG